MKKIYLLFSLSIMLFLIGCSKDNVVDPVSSQTNSANSNVTSLARKFFAAKMDPVAASDSIRVLIPQVKAEEVVESSYQAGYSPEDLVRILNLSFKEHPKETERILLGILIIYTTPQIAHLIINGYKDYLLNHEDELIYLINKFPDLKEKIMLLSVDFRKSFEQIYALLNSNGSTVNLVELVEVSQTQFNLDQKTLCQLLLQLKVSPTEIAQVLKENFHLSLADVGKALKELGFDLKQVYKALKNNYNFGSFKTIDLVNTLIKLGFDKKDVYLIFGIKCP